MSEILTEAQQAELDKPDDFEPDAEVEVDDDGEDLDDLGDSEEVDPSEVEDGLLTEDVFTEFLPAAKPNVGDVLASQGYVQLNPREGYEDGVGA